jgi:hypothetical protein
MRPLSLLCALLLTIVVCGAARAAGEKRVALIIGIGKYQNAPELINPPNDARLIGPVLEKLGFEVSVVIDPDYDTMKRALRDFGQRLEGAKVALFYYAGHGLQVAGRNYLLPVSVTLSREADLWYDAFDVQAVLDEMDAPGRTNLVFLDACRDNPLARSFAGRLGARGIAVGQGLAPIETQSRGTLIAYATAPGNVAMDGDGANSPFTTALVRHIATPGLDVRQMLTRVRADVQTATQTMQRPWVSESMDTDFYFVPLPKDPVATMSSEVVFWQSITGSTNPADFQAYIQQFPQGSFAKLAGIRIASLANQGRPAADENHAIAESLATMLRAGMALISRDQDKINDPKPGDKGLGGQAFLLEAVQLYHNVTGRDPFSIPETSRHGKLLRAQMDAIAAVMDANQAKLNAPGTGYKGFIPALFARLVNEEFSKRTAGEASIKTTAPAELVRNPLALPDSWEKEIISSKFLAPDWPPGQPFDATVKVKDRSAFRMMMPQYYGQSCLSCHGGPKGQPDVTGYPMEGGSRGELGAVISIILYQ